MFKGAYFWQKRALVLAVSFFVFPGLSYAGFEWHPPAVQEKPAVPVVKALPVAGVDSEAAGPIIDPDPMHVYGGDVSGLMPIPVNGHVIGGEGMTTSAPANFAKSEGFGRDLPLALAMQQIVPSDYAYSFDEEVDPSIRVSWDGGEPWNIVLKKAVSPFGFDVVVANKTAWVLPASKVAEHKAVHMRTVAVNPPQTTSGIAAIKQEVSRPYEAPVASEPLMPLAPPETGMAASEAATAHIAKPSPIKRDADDLRRIGMDETTYSTSYPRRTAPSSTRVTAQEAGTMSGGPTSLLPGERVADLAPAQGSFDFDDMGHWRANAGDSLQAVLDSWSEKAGTRLLWQVNKDYRLPSTINVRGTYPEAVTELLSAYSEARPQPQGKLYPNKPHGPSVLVVSAAGNVVTH